MAVVDNGGMPWIAGGGAISALIGALFPFPFAVATAEEPAETIAGAVGLATWSEGSEGGSSSECRPFVPGTSSESTVDLHVSLTS